MQSCLSSLPSHCPSKIIALVARHRTLASLARSDNINVKQDKTSVAFSLCNICSVIGELHNLLVPQIRSSKLFY